MASGNGHLLYRCFGWLRAANLREPGGALYVPRDHQGAGRHDNPDLYGALYLSESPVGAIAELLARSAACVSSRSGTSAASDVRSPSRL